jgi:putative ubiquitin-RnfH superfamily antitoxin RatB of RatAB toxin-antitoxin module
MDHDDRISIELVFASEQKQQLLSVEVAKGTSAREAIIDSGLVQKFPGTDFTQCPLGIWGRVVPGTQALMQGDRVEAYRQLRRDPRDARRELALAGRSMGGSSS